MKVHEYQGKKIFADYGMPVQDGYVFEKIEDAESTIKKVQKDFNTEDVIVKAQIHAGVIKNKFRSSRRDNKTM